MKNWSLGLEANSCRSKSNEEMKYLFMFDRQANYPFSSSRIFIPSSSICHSGRRMHWVRWYDGVCVVYTQRLYKSGMLLLKPAATRQNLFSFPLRLNIYSWLGMSLNKHDDNDSGIMRNLSSYVVPSFLNPSAITKESLPPPLQPPELGQRTEPQAVSCIV